MQWNEDLYEKQLIERTTDACGGPVDVVMNFGTTSRSLHRSLQCLTRVSSLLLVSTVSVKHEIYDQTVSHEDKAKCEKKCYPMFSMQLRLLENLIDTLFNQGGVVLVTEDVGEKLLPKFAKKVEEMGVKIAIVPNGSIEQLKELVNLVATGEVRSSYSP